MGFELQGEGIQEHSPTLTALQLPEEMDPDALRTRVREAGIQIAVGLGVFRPNCIRIGHMGDIRMNDVDQTMDVVEEAMDTLARN